jgi:hypothetical protein
VTVHYTAMYNGAWPALGSSADTDVFRAHDDAGGIGGGVVAQLFVELSGDDAGAQGRQAQASAFHLGR